MPKLNCTKEEALKFIEQNKGSMTNKQMGAALGGVSAARISQLKLNKPDICDGVPSVNQEAAASTAEA
jgi:hypothetical protein